MPFIDIMSSGLPKDDIPPLNELIFLGSIAEKEPPGDEPVVNVRIEGFPPRAYPIHYLTWHEIVNHRFG